MGDRVRSPAVVPPLVGFGLLAIGGGALGAAGLRVSSAAGATGLDRAIGAGVLACAAAVASALALGLVGAGSSPWALTGAAVAIWAAARGLLSPPGPGTAAPRVGEEIRAWWAGLGAPGRLLAGALAGLALGWTWFLVRSPALGFDAVQYHLQQVAVWVQGGSPGEVVDVSYDLPFGNYPLTGEVLYTWGVATARSWIPVALTSVALIALLAGAARAGLATLGVGRAPSILSTALVVTVPVGMRALNTPGTDLPAIAFLVSAAALLAASRGRPGLAAISLVAIGLAVGTKTTVAPLAVLLLAAGALVHRERLPDLARPLLGALALAVACGGVWYLRNLVDHGSPLWPFLDAPWGSERPPLLDAFGSPFLTRPVGTLEGRGEIYGGDLAGGLLLLVAVPVVCLLARRRAVWFAGGAWALAGIAWGLAPITGVGEDQQLVGAVLSTTRYLVPVIAAGTLALALATTEPGWARRVALGALALAVVWNVLGVLDLGRAHLPPLSTAANGVALGVIGAALLSLPGAARLALGRTGVAAAAAAACLALAPQVDGWVERVAAFDANLAAPLTGFMAAEPDFGPGERPVWMARTVTAPLAGDRLTHPVRLVPRTAPCERVRDMVAEGWVVISETPLPSALPFTAADCLREEKPVYEDERFRVYRDPG